MRGRLFKAERLMDIRTLVRRAGKLYAAQIAYKELGLNRQIVEYTYSRLEDDVDAFGTKLLEIGMKGWHFAIIGENSYTWVVSYLAVVNGIGVVVPLDKELTDEDIIKLLIKSDADAVICSKTYATAMKNILSKCPHVKNCIIMNPEQDYPDFFTMNSLIEEGRILLERGNREYLDAFIDREAMCEIVFTSGTTGANKGVMLSHKNIMAVVYGGMSLMKAEEISLSVLPINHTYECSCHILGGIYSGITVCFNDSLKRVANNMKLFKPKMCVMVPLFLESMYKNIWKEAEKNGLTKHLRYGIRVSNLIRRAGIDMRRKFFKPLLANFGGNLKTIICGGAPLRPELIKGLGDFGIEVLNGYGITECGPLVSGNSSLWSKKDSVGRVMPGCEVRVYNPDEKGSGEIQVKGDNVMLGYYMDPESTRLTFTEDGWFRTGDLGYLDRHNFLYINGREKNLIILANGKNVHPEEIEEIIIEKIPYIKEVVVYSTVVSGTSEGCINASVYIDEEACVANGIDNLQERLDRDIKILNRELPAYKRITNIVIRRSEFKKTTTKKIKRALIFEEAIENA